ncbi:MAG: hypothetical protein ACI9GZ_004345 [Bacteroidia bacterium]
MRPAILIRFEPFREVYQVLSFKNIHLIKINLYLHM